MDQNTLKVVEGLATLSAQVAGLREDLKESERRQSETNKQADQSRKDLHKRMDMLTNRTGRVEGQVESIQKALEDVKKTTDKVKQWEQRGIGALFVVGIASASLSGTIVYFWDIIVRAINRSI